MPPMALRSRSEIHPQEGQKWARFLRIAALLLRKLQPHLAVTFRIVAPAPAPLHEEEQMHGVFYNCDNVAPRLGADRLDGLATLSQYDLALALALDIDRLFDPDRAVLELLPLIGLNRRLIGQLLVQAQIELLARDLRSELPQRRVGDLVLGIVPEPGRHMGGEP